MCGSIKTVHSIVKSYNLILMEKLEVTVEVLETKELSTITTIVDKSGTTDQTTDNGGSNTNVYACCCCCCC